LFMKIGNSLRPKPHRGSAPFYGFFIWAVFVRPTNAICQFYSERCNCARAKPCRKSGDIVIWGVPTYSYHCTVIGIIQVRT
jgi:hypothetical protein